MIKLLLTIDQFWRRILELKDSWYIRSYFYVKIIFNLGFIVNLLNLLGVKKAASYQG